MSRIFSENIRLLALAALLAAALCAGGESARAADTPDTVTVAITLPPSILGRGSASFWDDVLKLQSILKKKYQINLVVRKEDSWEKVIRLLENGQADIAPLPPYHYASSLRRRQNLPFSPLAVFESENSTGSRHCIYMIPGDEGFPKADDPIDLLVASRVAFPDETEWVVLNLIFRDSIYRFEASTYMYFFESFQLLNRESAALALLFGQLDAVVMDEIGMKYVVEMDGRLAKASPIQCTGKLPNTPIVARKSMKPALRKKILGILTSMHNSPDFSQFRKYFKASDSRWVDAGKTDYSPWKEIARVSASSGWDKVFAALPVGD